MFTRSFALRHLCTAATVLALTTPGVVYAQAQTYALDIPAQDLGSALKALAGATGQQVVFREGTVRGKRSVGLSGRYTVDDALVAMLRGTSLGVSRSGRGVIVIKAAKVSETKDNEAPDIVVTGSHIRGGNPTSPVRTVGRKEIDNSGYSTIGELVRSLPENFSGGQNPGVFAAGATKVDNTNVSGASTINLRGLGSDATLVLVNGHRLTADGSFKGSDISVVPLGAIQRLEIMTDGASAVYGSDAVAGVANLITRKDYNGLELTAQAGGATQGGGFQQTYSLLAGKSDADGYILANLEYSTRSRVSASQRQVTSAAPPDNTLYPSSTNRSLFVSAGKELGNDLSIAFDGTLSDRDQLVINHRTMNALPYYYPTKTPAYSGTLVLDKGFGNDWKLRAMFGASGSRNIRNTSSGTYHNKTETKNDIQYLELTANGPLFQLPSGDVKIAFGGGYRREGFGVSDKTDPLYNYSASRTIIYGYAEAEVPLVLPSTARAGLNELEISLSGRTERYSDFGNSTNPKVGVRYVPFVGLTMRGTWGKSFKAPNFLNLYDPTIVYLMDAVDFGQSGGGAVLISTGGNKELKPETSNSWTFGGEYSSKSFSSLKLSFTYFNINFKNRVLYEPINNIYAALIDPLYAPYVETSPSVGVQTAIISRARAFYNFTAGDYDPASVIAILRDENANATSQKIRGFDLGYRQTFSLAASTLDTFANATWIEIRQENIPGAPSAIVSGTIFNTPRFKARGGASLSVAGLSATGVVNYVAGFSDNGVSPKAQISSWTTVDATLSYRFKRDNSWLRGLSATLAVSNLFDRDPPRTLSSNQPGIFYDSANASIIGRFISLSVTKAW